MIHETGDNCNICNFFRQNALKSSAIFYTEKDRCAHLKAEFLWKSDRKCDRIYAL